MARAVVIGEVLFDLFPDGDRLGGAPSNFAVHAAALGADVHLISAVGEDRYGKNAISSLTAVDVDTSGVRVSDSPTGTVKVTLSAGHPSYEIVEGVAWDEIDLIETSRNHLKKAQLLCWGTLAQRSCRSEEAHRQLFDLVPNSCLNVCDLNFRQHYHDADVVRQSLTHSDLLKLSDEDLPILRSYISGPKDDRDYLRDIRHVYGIRVAVLTLGERGCRVSARNVDLSVPGISVQVVNTVGAGDAFAAAFALNLLQDADLRLSAETANRVGAYVATQDSGTPSLPSEFRIVD